ncbi:MAG: hypothetical protein LRY76_09345 [Alphaproteobacteria bacterium]|nr:hypothetical protein [Alphaproteobacteria bacterium]MCD8571698.1 hypothetical protein [Alphaproteobacteria bacterium]
MTHLITPVVLAGGKGTCLWPLTSRKRPKPFLRPFSRNSLYQETLIRVQSFAPPVVITEEYNLAIAHREAQEMGVTPSFLLEPEGRGTAAALILAALSLQKRDGLMLITPSDHVIPDPDDYFPGFIEDIMHHAREHIVLIGVEPLAPETHYGYIEIDRDKAPPHPVFGSIEKPPLETARDMIAEGNALWNTGLFLAPPALFLERCASLKPRLFNDVKAAFDAGTWQQAVFRPDADLYREARNESIDRAILQRCRDLKCCPLPLPWYDAGCWNMFLTLKLRHIMRGTLTK